jgi:hypothetical protein
MSTLFYRLHHKARISKGIYRFGYHIWDWQEDIHIAPEDDSNLLKDVKIKFPHLVERFDPWGHFYYGFNSLRQLLKWFYNPEWIERMEVDGAVLSLFDVPFASSEYQAVTPLETLNHDSLKKTFSVLDIINNPANIRV